MRSLIYGALVALALGGCADRETVLSYDPVTDTNLRCECFYEEGSLVSTRAKERRWERFVDARVICGVNFMEGHFRSVDYTQGLSVYNQEHWSRACISGCLELEDE
jgi:hypothetical protein